MPDDTYQCWYGEDCHVGRRHTHPYLVGRWGAKRCQCGSRHFEVWCSQLGEPEVGCVKCKKRNYSATAYEVGCLTGRHASPLLDQLAAARSAPVPF